MPKAKLHVSLPPNTWITELSEAYPKVVFTVLAAMPSESEGVGLLELRGPSYPEAIDAMRGFEDVLSVSILEGGDDEAIVLFKTDRPFLLLAVRNADIPLEPPIRIRDGTAAIELTAPQEHLTAFSEQLEQFGMSYEIEYLYQTIESEALLTDRQERLMRAAVEAGYYDTPRRCTLTDLAEREGIAKSTASETIHRAEEKVIKQYFEDLQPSVGSSISVPKPSTSSR